MIGYRQVLFYRPDIETGRIGDSTPSATILSDQVVHVFDLVNDALALWDIHYQLTRPAVADAPLHQLCNPWWRTRLQRGTPAGLDGRGEVGERKEVDARRENQLEIVAVGGWR